MSNHSFDYAIIGAGAAGLHLAIKMEEDPHFKDCSILIIDKDEKTADDRTWSFWEKGKSKWDKLAFRQWDKAAFHGKTEHFDIPLQHYTYKTIRSSAFYEYAKEKINNAPQFTMVLEEVTGIDGQSIRTLNGAYSAKHIFDSQVSADFPTKNKDYQSLTQHFLGWFIKTKKPVFKKEEVMMMDYRLQWKSDTSFTYVLPFSPTYALVEFTLFNEALIEDAEYEEKLKEYISTYLKISDFTVEEIEQGAIPMSDYPFQKEHSKNVTKIGTAGGWVRPSSGYSFKNADRYSQKIIDNLKKGRTPHKGVATSRFRMYDSIFLRVLKERNDLGVEIFQTLYTKHPANRLFRFLDEQSSVFEDLSIMLSLNKPIFQKALLKSLFGR